MKTTGLHLRPAEAGDRDELFALYAGVLKVHICAIWGWDEDWQRQDFDSHFVPSQIRVVEMDGAIAAYLQVEEKETASHVRMMCVRPQDQRKGIGHSLLSALVSDCAARQRDVELAVFRINTEALRLYQRLGFQTVGESPTHYRMRWAAA